MLPTKDGSVLSKAYLANPSYLRYNQKGYEYDSFNVNDNQHVYITVSQDVEPIKEGDWCIFGYNLDASCNGYKITKDSILQCTGYCENGYLLHKDGNTGKEHCRKIIATTDLKLFTRRSFVEDISNNTVSLKSKLPQPQQSFLKEWVANPDGEYEVEYKVIRQGEHYSIGNITGYKLKLNQDNTVNITSVSTCEHPFKRLHWVDVVFCNKCNTTLNKTVEEKMYSGVDLMGNQDGSFDHFLLNSSKFSQEEREIAMDAIHDWIKEKLSDTGEQVDSIFT